MVTHKFFETAVEVDKFLNSSFKQVIAITSHVANYGVSYTVFYVE